MMITHCSKIAIFFYIQPVFNAPVQRDLSEFLCDHYVVYTSLKVTDMVLFFAADSVGLSLFAFKQQPPKPRDLL